LRENSVKYKWLVRGEERVEIGLGWDGWIWWWIWIEWLRRWLWVGDGGLEWQYIQWEHVEEDEFVWKYSSMIEL